jgi:nicotinamidase/pyrazinamidase
MTANKIANMIDDVSKDIFANPSLNRRRMLAGLGAAAAVGAFTGLMPGRAHAAIKPGKNAVLLVIDLQNCFLPGGTLPVKGGNEIIPVINALGKKFDNVVFTQD